MTKYKLIRKLNLPHNDRASILKGAGLAVGGALLGYLTQNLANVNFGSLTFIIVPCLTVILDVVRKIVFNDPLMMDPNAPES